MVVETLFAVAAIVLAVVGGRVRCGQQGPPAALVPSDGRATSAPRSEAVRRSTGVALEAAAMVCLLAAAAIATIRHRDDVDLSHLTLTLVAVVVVAAILVRARRRATGPTQQGPGGATPR